jgi:hypothetical protein
MKVGPSGSAIRSLIPSHRGPLWSKATVVSAAEQYIKIGLWDKCVRKQRITAYRSRTLRGFFGFHVPQQTVNIHVEPAHREYKLGDADHATLREVMRNGSQNPIRQER